MKLSATKVEPIDRIEVFPGAVGVSEPRYEALKAIDEYGEIASEGTIDANPVMDHFGGTRTLLYSAFGHHGRIARYTTDISGPTIDTIRDRVRSSGDVHSMLDAVEEYGFVDIDGTINAEIAYENSDKYDLDVQSSQFYKNVGKYCRVLLPRSEYNASDSKSDQERSVQDTVRPFRYSSAHLDEYDCAILDSTRQHWPAGRLPKNQYEAFVLGWKLRGQWDSLELTDHSGFGVDASQPAPANTPRPE